MAGHTNKGTIVPYADFDKEADALILRKAMKGMGTDEKAIIDIMTERSNEQRQEIRQYYKACYGRELTDDFKSETGGHFRDVIIGLMDPPPLYHARCLRKAMKGLGTDEKALVEILCTKNNDEINAIKEAYKKDIGRNLERDIESDTSGDFKRLLLAMCAAGREENFEVDEEKAVKDAKVLYNAGEKFWGTNEAEIQRILAIRSYTHLQRTFEEYDQISKLGIEGAIESETSGDLKDGYLAIVQCVKDPAAFFASRLNQAIKGIGTNNDMLIRCMISRAEIDMITIKERYAEKFGKSLLDDVKGDTSGHYKHSLVAIIGERS